MPVEIASAYVSIIPSAKGIAAELDRELSGPLNAAAKRASDQASQTLSQAGTQFTKFGVGALAVAGAIGVGLFKTGESASNLGESINAVQVTFGKSATGILKLGEDAAKSVGLSNVAFNSLAVQFSNFAITVAGKGGDVVGVMKDLTGRAGDFASVMNIEVADAATLFQSGLAGETEPLRKYGIDLSAAAVNAFAAANGIGTLGEQLTESEKVTARYGLLMKSTAKDQGDFANTSDSAANSMRIAKAEMENASASIGASFAPAMAFAATKVSDLVGGFANLNDATGGWLGKAAGIAAVALGAAGAFSVVIGQAMKMHDRFTAFGSSLSTLKTRLSGVEFGVTKLAAAMAAIGLVTLAATVWYSDQAEKKAKLRQVTDEFVDALKRESEGQKDAVKASIAAQLSNKDLIETAKQFGLSITDLADIVLGKQVPAFEAMRKQIEDDPVRFQAMTGASDATLRSFRELTGGLDPLTTGLSNARAEGELAAKVTTELGVATDKTTGALLQEGAQFDYTTLAAQLMKGATEEMARATEEATRKSEAHKTAIENERESLRTLYGIERTAVEAKYAFIESTKQANADITALNDTLKHHKEGTEEATAATDAAKGSILQNAENYATLKGATLDSRDGTLRQIDALKLQAAQLAPGSELRKYLLEYINDLHNIEANVTTTLNLVVKRSARPGVMLVDGEAATGGWRSGRMLVGEDGPEVVDLPQGSYVHTAAETRAMAASNAALMDGATSAGPTVTIGQLQVVTSDPPKRWFDEALWRVAG